MQNDALRLTGDPAVLIGLRPALDRAGYRIGASGARLWIHAGAAESLGSTTGLGLLLAPVIVSAELQLLAAGNVDVALATAPEAEILARLEALRQRSAPELELRRTRDFLEHLIDGSCDAIIASDMRGRLLVFNRAAERMFGISAADARAQMTVIDLYPKGGAREMMRLLREAPTGHIEAVRGFGHSRSGELIPVEVSASVIRMGGAEVATLGLLRDLRERVRVESELSRTRARLVDAEKQAAITALAGTTAHELNQPLTVVLGYVELIKRKADPSQHRALDTIARQAERMAEIVSQISQLTHVELQPYPGERQIVDLERSVVIRR